MVSVFQNHREWNSKKWVGVSHITIQSAIRNTKCFFLHRIDGTSTDISYVKSISTPSKKHSITLACRNAIQPFITEFRNTVQFWIDVCPITGDILTQDNTDIDHYDLEFSELYNIWKYKYTEEYLYTQINGTMDNSFDTYFTNPAIVKDFIEFHNSHTHLRAVTKFANQSILRLWK